MKENYITAVLEALKAGEEPDKVIEGLKKTLQSKGHLSLYAAVLRGVYRVLSSGSADSVMVKVTNQASYDKQKASIEAALKELGATKEARIILDETIIGGYIAEANDKRLDKSYKSKLVSLYRSLTK